MKHINLNTCKTCGVYPKVKSYVAWKASQKRFWYECPVCKSATSIYKKMQDAANEWNVFNPESERVK